MKLSKKKRKEFGIEMVIEFCMGILFGNFFFIFLLNTSDVLTISTLGLATLASFGFVIKRYNQTK